MGESEILEYFVKKNKFHLLSIPREYASIGDIYSYNDREASEYGSLTDLLEPQFEIPQIRKDEVMADISGKISKGVSLSFGMKLLGGFLGVFGGSGIISAVQAGYESKATRFVKFSFSEITRDSVNVNLLRRKMSGHKIADGEEINGSDNKYYVVTAVVKSPSVNISAEDANSRSLDVNVEAAKMANASGKVSIENAREGEVVYKGDKSIVFGIELYQLDYDNENKSFRMHEVTKTTYVRDIENKETPIRQKVIEPAVIKDPEKGEDDGFLIVINR